MIWFMNYFIRRKIDKRIKYCLNLYNDRYGTLVMLNESKAAAQNLTRRKKFKLLDYYTTNNPTSSMTKQSVSTK